ncbi:desmoglein-2-like [Morone saxatilis]|uniref:desmoglein-2-like n=1 Tax=Morone saxatilis TaxID=34816 RepID=UPI0015E1BF94|nr:desmoglein-2-like [Morone saxatilis]
MTFMLVGGAANVPQLRRHKRDWVIPTNKLKENFDYTTAGYVAKIRSDSDKEMILYYSLLGPGANEVPLNLFVVQETTGLVYIRGSLDREERETYIYEGAIVENTAKVLTDIMLTGVARFNNGSVAEAGINLRFDVEDENDNTPVFVPVPPATVNESSPAGTLVGVITATDADKANSSHSKIAYSIEKQEPSDGTDLFYIDRNTGSIYIKENTLDRERQSSYILTVTGSDMDGAPGANTGTGTIHVHVVDINDNRPMLDKDEKPSVKPVFVSENPEDNPLMEVIAVFKATDTDNGKPAENVRYAKGYDPDNWLLIDPETAEIRLQKYPDRESPFLVNGTYYAKILSVTDETPPKMITGTIALQVGDVNDNCPSLTNDVEYICSDTEVINVTVVDEDGDPNSAPFSFSLLSEETQGEWRVEPSNDTRASLRALRPLWPGHYKVAFIIQDQQGLACPDPQYLDLYVCSFVAVFLVTCSCRGVSGTFTELPFDTREHLIVYHTEGRGEDKNESCTESPLVFDQFIVEWVGDIVQDFSGTARGLYPQGGRG